MTKELLLAPIKGAAFCLFLPFIGFALLAMVMWQGLRRGVEQR